MKKKEKGEEKEKEEKIEKENEDEKENEKEKEEEVEEEEQGPVPTEEGKEGEQEEGARKEGEQGEEEALGEEVPHDLCHDSSDEEVVIALRRKGKAVQRKSKRLASKQKAALVDDITSETIPEPTSNEPLSPKPTTPPPHHNPSPPQSPIHFTPPPFPSSPGTGCAISDPVPEDSSHSVLSKLNDLQSQFSAFQDEVRVSLASIVDQFTMMEDRLGAKLDTVEVQTEYINEEETAP